MPIGAPTGAALVEGGDVDPFGEATIAGVRFTTFEAWGGVWALARGTVAVRHRGRAGAASRRVAESAASNLRAATVVVVRLLPKKSKNAMLHR
jgi:hypothetical protein